MRVLKKIISAIVLIAVGTILVLPIEAKVSSAGITIKWLSKKYYSKKQANKRYYTKSQANSRYYTKTQSNSRYYPRLTVDLLLTNYLSTSTAASTYLTQSSAASSYLPLSGGTLTGSLSASDYSYSSAQTKYLNIPGSAFRPESDLLVNSGNGGSIWAISGTPTLYADAPIHLPDGATVTAARVYYYDNSASDLSVYIDRHPIDSTTPDRFGSTTASSGASGSLRTFDIPINSSQATIDNNNYSYYSTVTFGGTGSTLYFRMMKITYTISSP